MSRHGLQLARPGGLAPGSHRQTRRQAALSPAQERALLEMLAQGAVHHGFPNEVWTAKRIAKLIRRHFGVQYHFKSIPALLARLGWSWQKPEKRAKGHNDEQIARWAAEDWPRIKKGS